MQDNLIALELDKMMHSKGWEYLVQVWNIKREEIITKGETARIEATQTKLWAELAGFDSCAKMAEEFLHNVNQKREFEEGQKELENDIEI